MGEGAFGNGEVIADGLLPRGKLEGVRLAGTAEGASFQPPLSRLMAAGPLGGGAKGAEGVGPRCGGGANVLPAC